MRQYKKILQTVLLLAAALAMVLSFAGCGGGGGGGGDSFTISYNANGAESGTAPASQNGSDDKPASIQDNTGNLARAGYLFDGWNTATDGNGKTYTPGTKHKGGSLKLYAKWAAIYKVQNMGISPAPAFNGVQKASGSSNLKILGLTEKGKSLTVIDIPSAIDGNTIKAIGSGAFAGCTGITAVTIPASVTSIGAGAFSGCSSLATLVINSTVPPAIDGDILDGTSAVVRVPESAIGAYASAWSACSAGIEGSYTVTIDSMSNGSVTGDITTAQEGDTVTLTITPDSGYGLDSLTVTKSGGGTVDVSGDGNTRTFTMPASDVTVTATFSLLLVYTSTPADRSGVSVGDIVLADKKTVAPSEYTSYKAAYESVSGVPVGVVAYMGGDDVEDLYKPFLAGTAKVGTNGKVYMVGLLQSGSDLVWAPTDTTGYNTIFSTSYNDGSGNWAVIKAADSAGTATAELIATNYPAFSYAATYTATGYTSGWYLPALAELKRIALNSDTINDGFTAITGAGGTANALTENNYWSSSQFDNGAPYKTHAGYVNFSADKSICTNKSTMFFVRVVRALDD